MGAIMPPPLKIFFCILGKNLEYDWFKRRGYLHFDTPIIKPSEKIPNSEEKFKTTFKKLTGVEYEELEKNDSFSKVESHQFLPFIQFATKTPKLKRLEDCKAVKKLPPKIRYLSYASHKDSLIYSLYAYKLSQKYETRLGKEDLNENILAFRKISVETNLADENQTHNKSNIHFAKDAFDIISQQESCMCLCLDIKKFFDNLNHEILKKAWLDILKMNDGKFSKDWYKVYKSLTRYAYVEYDEALQALGISKTMARSKKKKGIRNKKRGNSNKRLFSLCRDGAEFRNRIGRGNLIRVNYHKGIPQGSPLSGLLANIYMMDFDINLKKYLELSHSRYFRYCDDILIIIPGHDIQLLKNIQTNVSELVEKQKLQIQETKTEIVFFEKVDNCIKAIIPDLKQNQLFGNCISKKGYLQYLGMIFDGERALIRPGSISRYYKKLHKAKKLAIKSRDKHHCEILFKRKLYRKYSHLGRKTFVAYARRAAQCFDDCRIKRQVRKHFKKI